MTLAERLINKGREEGRKQGQEQGEIKGQIKTWQMILKDSIANSELIERAKQNIANLTQQLERINANAG